MKLNLTIRDMVHTAMFAAILCVISPHSINIGAVPITLGVLGVLLTGALLSVKTAPLSVVVYLLLGLAGLQVFSNYKAGLSVFAGPTGGFLLAYPFMAFVVALSVKLFGKRNLLSLGCGMLAALLICYALGSVWFMAMMGTGLKQALMTCVVPFIPFDLGKAALAIAGALAVEKAAGQYLSTKG